MRYPLIIGNWKMNGSRALVEAFAAKLVEIDLTGGGNLAELGLALCPPATLLAPLAHALQKLPVMIGGQNCSPYPDGAHTGETSLSLLHEAGARMVIVGHSERRLNNGENNAIVRAKVGAALEAGFQVIVCVGEDEAVRRAGKHESFVRAQLAASLPSAYISGNLVVAYEPIWAIGTGAVCQSDDIVAINRTISSELANIAATIPVIYGGSVKPENAGDILALPGVSGVLVGGASLDPNEFAAIIAAGFALKR